jgi:hypothetical protein
MMINMLHSSLITPNDNNRFNHVGGGVRFVAKFENTWVKEVCSYTVSGTSNFLADITQQMKTTSVSQLCSGGMS